MGKIIDKIRARERRRVSKLICDAQREHLMRLIEAQPATWFWRLVDRLRGRR